MEPKSRPGSVSHGPRPPRAAEYLTRHIDALEETQTELAERLGYPRPQIVSMWKSGRASIPLNRVEAIASAVGADPSQLLRLVLEDHYPEVARILETRLGPIVSKNERALLDYVRSVTADADPPLTTELRKRLKDALSA